MRSAEPGGLSDDEWGRHQRIIAGFESAWMRGERPKIGHYIPEDEPHREALLLELVHADLEFRLKAGESARVEDYLRIYPALAKGRETVLELIRAECTIRRGQEPGLKFDRYRSRFPEFGAELQTPVGEASTIQAGPASRKSPPVSPPAAERSLPRRFGKFELREKLGEGSFGVVYRAWDPVLKREVAVKLPRDEVAKVGPEHAVFLRDARNSLNLRHPNIVEILDAGPIDGVDCMVRAYIEGKTLAERLREGPFTPIEAAALVGIVAEAVDYAHRQGIIHRDLKPSNILLDLVGKPYVMDFGLAKREAGESTLSPAGSAGLIIGTPAYMAPEQARGENLDVDARSDVYSLGVILYELMTGSVPFRGRGRMLQVQIQEAEPIPPRSLYDEIPADLDTICLKALAKAPGGRYQTAKAMADDLQNFLEGRPVGARPELAGRSARTPWWKSIRGIAAFLAGSALLLALAFMTTLWLQAEDRRARDANGLEQTYLALLDVAGVSAPERIGTRSDSTSRARELAEGLSPMLQGDPALLEVWTDACLRLAEQASAEGSDARAAPRWKQAVLACEASLIERPDQPSRVVDLSRACMKLAEVRRRIRDEAGARSLFARSILLLSEASENLEARAGGNLKNEEARLGLAECLLLRAEARSAVGEPSEIDEVESISRDLYSHSWTATPSFKRRLGRMMLDVSRRRLAEGQPSLAEESARKGHRLYRDAGPEGDSSPLLARSCLAMARADRVLDRIPEAIERSSEAVRHLEGIIQPGPGRAEDRRVLAEALFESARLLDRPPSRARAIERYRRSIQVGLDLDRDYPEAHATIADLARVRASLARSLEAEGRAVSSIANRLIATLDMARAFALAPGEDSYRETLRDLARELSRATRALFRSP